MIERVSGFNVLPCPACAFIAREEDRAASADDPASFVADKIDVNQLRTTRSTLSAPCLAAVVGVHEDTVYHSLTFTD